MSTVLHIVLVACSALFLFVVIRLVSQGKLTFPTLFKFPNGRHWDMSYPCLDMSQRGS